MEEFFGRLLAENDPARLAALAEQAPDPPDLTGDGPAAIDLLDAPARDVPSSTPGLEAEAAAAAEVAATEGLDLGSAGDWPAAVQAGARRADAGAAEGEDAGSTRLTVTGLASVAGISAFKGALGQLAGVQNVSVTSGERGAFQFAVVHEPGFDLAAGLAGLADFGARVTDAKNGNLDVVAHEPTAA
jgi:hypothetical protein